MDHKQLSRYIFETLQITETLRPNPLDLHRDKLLETVQELGRGERFDGPDGWCFVPGVLDDLLRLLKQDLHNNKKDVSEAGMLREHAVEVAIHGLEFSLGLIDIHRPWAREPAKSHQ